MNPNGPPSGRMRETIDHAPTEMSTPFSETLVRDVAVALRQRDRFRAALRTIANINNGPDRASGEWRCAEAAHIAADALRPEQP